MARTTRQPVSSRSTICHQRRKMNLRPLVTLLFVFTAAVAQAATFNVPAGNTAALKEALAAANSNGEDDVINLALAATYQISSTDNTTNGATGLPVLTADGGHSVTINGNGASLMRAPAGGSSDLEFRVLQIGPNAMVTLRNLTVTNGVLPGPGGGIYNDAGNLTLIDCTVAGNSIRQSINNNNPPLGPLHGAGIYNHRGTLALRSSTFRMNVASGMNFSDPANSAYPTAGGAVYNSGGTVTVELSTFSGNSATASSLASTGSSAGGGAIANHGSSGNFGRVTITNSTFSGNSARAANNSGVTTLGSAIYNAAPASAAQVEIGSSIIAGDEHPQLSGAAGTITSHGYNLSSSDGNGFLSAVGDQTNIDPQLRALARNGGPTETHALRITSPALDKGKRDAVPGFAVSTDQRGAARPFDQPRATIAPYGDGSDIGAFEKGPPDLVVTTTGDHNDGSCSAEDCTLREAVAATNALPGIQSIAFAPGVTGTINLVTPLDVVSDGVEIDGPGANLLTVRRESTTPFRIFTISNGTSIGPDVVIAGLTLTNGQGVDSGTPGGAIYNDRGTLRLDKCAVVANNGNNGAGIMNLRGFLTIVDSTISNNTGGVGGGLFNQGSDGSATLTLINSTVSSNTASRGAAIQNVGPNIATRVTLQNCTISDNSAPLGTIFNDGARANILLRNTIVKAGASGATIVSGNGGTVTSGGNNISSDTTGGALNQPGDMPSTDPKLDPAGLTDNGGPTATHALQSTSPALDAANNATAPPLDQRGFVRAGIADIGAFEFGGTVPPPPPTPTPSATPSATPQATPTPPPNRFINISTRLRVETGDNVLIGGFIVAGSMQKRILIRAIGPSLEVDGKLSNPVLELYRGDELIATNDNWEDAPNQQEIIDSTIAPTNAFESAILRNVDLGAYTAIVRDAADGAGVGLVEVYDLGNVQDSKLANIATRGRVQTGNNVMIGGLIIIGETAQKVIVRAIGPSLGIAGQLEDPFLELFDSSGNLISSNNNWRETQQAEIEATTIPPPNDLESAIVASLPPAAYTAVVRGVNDATGVAVVEVYALQ